MQTAFDQKAGLIPANVAVTQAAFDEVRLVSNIKQGNILTVQVSRALINRKLYCYFYFAGAAASYVIGRIKFVRSNTIVGSIPISLGTLAGVNTLTSSLISALVSFGFNGSTTAPGGDCIALTMSNPLAGETGEAFMVPFYCTGDFDSLVFEIERIVGVTQLRVIMGAVSLP